MVPISITRVYIQTSVPIFQASVNVNLTALSPLPHPFHRYPWAVAITQAGELITLPVVVLIAFLAQPQLFFAMAQDGLLPGIFARTNKRKTLVWGTAVSGISMTVIAVCVPFSNLGDMISAGVLLSFNMSKSSIAPNEGSPRRTRPMPTPSPFAHYTAPPHPVYPHTSFQQ